MAKTVLQELIERLRVMINDLPSGSSRALGLATAADLATDLKEFEKQQIIDAYYDGTAQFANDAEIVRPLKPEDYYNQTFKP